LYHIGIVVVSLEPVMDELTKTRGLRWEEIRSLELAGQPLRVTYSYEGPPHIELVEGRPDPAHPFDTTAGTRFDHLGYWSDDLAEDVEQLSRAGLILDFDGRNLGGNPFTIHRSPSAGLRVQLTDGAGRASLERRLSRS
jgi:hypothetical protein